MRVLFPLPTHDGDPSEIAISWRLLREANHTIVFTTPHGQPATADPLMLSGEGLDPWGRVAGLCKLRLIGLMLRADRRARRAWRELEVDAAFRAPVHYDALRADDFDALLLPGGHAKGVREYLESPILQRVVADFFDADKPVAAICHGVVLAARSVSSRSGRSVLHGRKTTALTWKLEKSAWDLTRYVARWWDPHYYRTYRKAPGEPAGYRSVQAEVTRALQDPADFRDVETSAPFAFRRGSGLFRDSREDSRCAFVVRDGRYVSARWPGDVHTFARAFVALLAETAASNPL